MTANPKRARLLGLLLLVVVFAVGALTGAAAMRMTADSAAESRQREATRERRPGLWESLELTPEQKAQVDAIMERRSIEVEAFWNEHGPKLRAVMDSARAEVREILTPEQRAIEERHHAERRRRSSDGNR